MTKPFHSRECLVLNWKKIELFNSLHFLHSWFYSCVGWQKSKMFPTYLKHSNQVFPQNSCPLLWPQLKFTKGVVRWLVRRMKEALVGLGTNRWCDQVVCSMRKCVSLPVDEWSCCRSQYGSTRSNNYSVGGRYGRVGGEFGSGACGGWLHVKAIRLCFTEAVTPIGETGFDAVQHRGMKGNTASHWYLDASHIKDIKCCVIKGCLLTVSEVKMSR